MNHFNKKGFTIIELIVVVAVFLFIIGAAIGIFISVVKGQKNILSDQQIVNQISYLEEYMSKALRMAIVSDENITCSFPSVPTDIEPGDIYTLTDFDQSSTYLYKGIAFRNSTEDFLCQRFYWDGESLYENSIYNGYSKTTNITPLGLQISSVRFALNGDANNCNQSQQTRCAATNEDGIQPRVTIILKIIMPSDGLERIFQITVSRRSFNVR